MYRGTNHALTNIFILFCYFVIHTNNQKIFCTFCFRYLDLLGSRYAEREKKNKP